MELTRQSFAKLSQQALAQFLLALDENQMVPAFADRYISAFKRPELKSNPEQYAEMVAALRRESLLFALLHAETVLPRYLPRPKRRITRSLSEAQAVKIFRESALEHLARIGHWNPNEVYEFRRDLAIYESLAARRAPVPRSGQRQAEAGGPFADRCALLLDPSMLERARLAASEFRGKLMRLMNRVLRETFQPHRRQ
jgi:hypothetical protein